jgi:hypothetical protein
MRALAIAFALFSATAAHADWLGQCDHEAARSASQSAAGVNKVVIIGRAGFLHIEGHAGATEIKANGTACASSDAVLAGTRLSATRSGAVVTVEAVIPEQNEFFSSSARLDFTVTLPAGMEIDVSDTSGEMTISNVGNARVVDTSGGIEIHKVTGNLSVRDTSGEIEIEDVTGDVRIPSDSSGSISIERVGGSVTIDEDGSGSVNVSDVRGDFTLGSKGSGSVDYSRVGGRVSVPDRHRH